MEGELSVEYVDFEDIIKWPRNPKDHDSPTIQRSITRFGFTSPIIVDEKSGKLVAGHGRIESLRMLRKNRRPCPKGIRESNDTWYVPVIRGVSFDSENEAEAYLLVDNRLVEIGGWQDDMLAEILQGMDDSLKPYTGFFQEDIDQLIAKMDPDYSSKDKEVVKEEPPIIPRAEECLKIWKVQQGDIWQLGNHKVACIDFRSKDWAAAKDFMFQRKAQGVVTSPPYANQRKKQYGGVEMEDYSEWFYPVQNNIKSILSPKGHFLLNIKSSVAEKGEHKYQRHWYVQQLVLDMIKKWKWFYVDEYVWVHTTPPKQVRRRFKNFFEPIHWFTFDENFDWYPNQVMQETTSPLDHGRDKPKEWKNTQWDATQGESMNRVPIPTKNKGYAYPSNVLKIGVVKNVGHPAPYPVKLPEFFMKAKSKKGDLWFDPFCGSGTSILAAENTERVCYGTELFPKYMALICERMKYLSPSKIGNIYG